jgi:hypothetical protein
MKIKDAVDQITREDTPVTKLVDTVRMTGGILIVITEHESDLRPHLNKTQVTRRLTVFEGDLKSVGRILKTTRRKIKEGA